MDARTKNGAIPDADIINLAAGMVWGGFATTWGHLSWALIQLLQHSDYLEAVMQEQWELFGKSNDIRPDALAHLNH